MQVKGFITVFSLLSNETGVVSPIGELSPIAETFSRNKGFYNLSTLPDYQLTTFLSVDQDNLPVVLTTLQSSRVIQISDWLRSYIAAHLMSLTIVSIRNAIYTQFPSSVSEFNMGQLDSILPQWISWKDPGNGDEYTIWFSDEAFRNQYDIYEIVVVPPVPNIDTFFQTYTNVVVALNGQPITTLIERIGAARDGYPETVMNIVQYDYIPPASPTTPIATNWGILVYGNAGDNVDSIKDAITTYIADHSTYTQQDWENIFPEIYHRTEFFIIPNWDAYSINNSLTQSGLYSQVLNPQFLLDRAAAQLSFYTEAFVRANTYVMPSNYKQLLTTLTNGEHNSDGLEDFKTLYPDALTISSQSLDYARMSLETQEVMTAIYDLLVFAETMTLYSFIPAGMRRIQRSGHYYISKVVQGVNYIVIPKADL